MKFEIEWNCFDLSTVIQIYQPFFHFINRIFNIPTVLQKSTDPQTHTNKTKTIKKEAIPF
ncbi:hypothetical protein [Rossellomorea sp. NRS-1567]|uniref:hypothetical protein n=1 Tax=Rossellomorea sp. NRS-1567 TaxID=3233901 RepID=UPI003D27E93F